MCPNEGSPGPVLAHATSREILVGVCGGISAYKVCELVSTLVQAGAGVTVAMTRSARRFVGPTTFESLTGRKVLTSLWMPNSIADSPHIRLTRAADVTVVAPATANMIGKISCGIADDLVSTLVISAELPVLLAPAMNDRMWSNPIVQANVKKLTELGYSFVGPDEGWLACRTLGKGRMADPKEIGAAIEMALIQSSKMKGAT